MKKIKLIFIWETRRVLSNWKQTVSVFIIPSFVLLVALYLLPVMVDFLASGTFGRPNIYLVDAPPSFVQYAKTEVSNPLYQFEYMSQSEFEEALNTGKAYDLSQRGHSFALFSAFPHIDHSKDVSSPFEDNIIRLYDSVANENESTGSLAFVLVFSNNQNPKSFAIGSTFIETSLPQYETYLSETLGAEYEVMGGGAQFSINEFNPYFEIMRFRSIANASAGRILPAIVGLILYYTTYSLTGEILAFERAYGFLAKIALTPIKKSWIIAAKAGAIVNIGLLNGLLIIGMLIIVSWSNIQNNPFSLIPFGFLPFASQIFMLIPIILLLSIFIAGYCFKTVFDHDKPQDILFNLQFPLILFLFTFFMHLFRNTSFVFFEYFIPAYGAIAVMRDIFEGSVTILNFSIVIIVHVLLSAYLFYNTHKNFSPFNSFSDKPSRRL